MGTPSQRYDYWRSGPHRINGGDEPRGSRVYHVALCRGGDKPAKKPKGEAEADEREENEIRSLFFLLLFIRGFRLRRFLECRSVCCFDVVSVEVSRTSFFCFVVSKAQKLAGYGGLVVY
ncbi:hypothetical protein HPP92_014354 [Vanilla planifolia]|uniref:Uncharacterized protein n=1 Tax=Vanilla planifolia TaxID=51239 RepID=A0A835UUP9_VANPL|nr:hypothetical protein HPP92_014354 [Vanilla planifolia]